MRLKSFYAKTMAEAMQMIRDTLGDDAIIVATREENGGKAVRVTAAIDRGDAPGAYQTAPHFELGQGGTAAAPADDWLQYDQEQESETNAVSEDLTDVMLAHGVTEDVTDQILSCAMVIGYRDVAAALEDSLDHLFQYRPLLSGARSPKPYVLVGPPGVGKTLMVAKLAARAVMDGARVAVFTTDSERAGGFEQLAAFTRILKIDLQRIKNTGDLSRALRDLPPADHVFIDTAGTLPYQTDDVRDLARMLTSVDTDPVLAIPAGMDSTEAGEMARIFAAIGVRRMMATRLDVGRRLGGILAAAHQGGLSLAELSHSPQVAEGLAPTTPRRLTEFLLPRHKRTAAKTPSTPLSAKGRV